MAAITNNSNDTDQIRIYNRAESVVFLKTKELWGGFSNMAGGNHLCVNGTRILTSEALYQACRFPHIPEIQKLIISERSPMAAKMKINPYREKTRPDWYRVRIQVMRWCLRVKLAQNWEHFGELLLSSQDKPIVEQSHNDTFWGTKVVDEKTLVGKNVLGRLLMELREKMRHETAEDLIRVPPLPITNFMLFDQPIELIGEITKNIPPSGFNSERSVYPLFDNI